MVCVRTPGLGDQVTGTTVTVSNWAGSASIEPQAVWRPNTVDELVAIVRDAEAKTLKVRAVGSGWSFSDIMLTPDYQVLTDSLNKILGASPGMAWRPGLGPDVASDAVTASLTQAAQARFLVHVEAGIVLRDLYSRLETDFDGGGDWSDGFTHGFALKTLGGSGGQSLAGVIATASHGGDVHLPPIAEMVQGLRLVAAGGAEFFLQREAAIVDAQVLQTLMPCITGHVVTDDDTFNAALVGMGRLGIVYSMVLEVDPQYVLAEARSHNVWSAVRGDIIDSARADPVNRFLQVVINPYPDNGDYKCFITTRIDGNPNNYGRRSSSETDMTELACKVVKLVGSPAIVGMIASLSALIGTLYEALPFAVGPLAVAIVAAIAAASATIAVLAPLADSEATLGDYIARVTDALTQVGLMGIAQTEVNTILDNGQQDHTIAGLSYEIMDTYNPKGDCFRAQSLEVAFNADEGAYLDFVADVLAAIQSFADQNILYGGYVALRYCGRSAALLAMERYEHTVCIEMSSLAGLESDAQVFAKFSQLAQDRKAPLHWGQINDADAAYTETLYGGDDKSALARWRAALVRLAQFGSQDTFDNDFCVRHGLEPAGARLRPLHRPNLAYLKPLLLNG